MQLDVQRQIAALRTDTARPEATATAVANRALELERTAMALATAQAQLAQSQLPPSPTGGALWNEQRGNVPDWGSELIRELAAGETLYLSSGRFMVNGVFCGDDETQLCVLVYEATTPQRVIITELIERQNYLARTSRLGYDELVSIHQEAFWAWPNCQSPIGCEKATVFRLIDGQRIGSAKVLWRK